MPPGENTESWPATTQPVIDLWKLASENLQTTIIQHSDTLKVAGAWLLTAVAGIGISVLQFIISTVIAGV